MCKKGGKIVMTAAEKMVVHHHNPHIGSILTVMMMLLPVMGRPGHAVTSRTWNAGTRPQGMVVKHKQNRRTVLEARTEKEGSGKSLLSGER